MDNPNNPITKHVPYSEQELRDTQLEVIDKQMKDIEQQCDSIEICIANNTSSINKLEIEYTIHKENMKILMDIRSALVAVARGGRSL